MLSKGSRKRLGELLIDQGVITADDLGHALNVQKTEGGLLGEVLIKLQLVTEEDIVIALATQFNYPYMDVDSFNISPDLAKNVPLELASRFTFIAVDKLNDILTIVMSDPSNEDAVREIQRVTACRVQSFVGTVSQIEGAIKKQYKVDSLQKANTDQEKVKISFKSATDEKLKKET